MRFVVLSSFVIIVVVVVVLINLSRTDRDGSPFVVLDASRPVHSNSERSDQHLSDSQIITGNMDSIRRLDVLW